MGRVAGSIVTLVLLVLFAVAGTSPARAAVRGEAGNGQEAHHHQRRGDHGGQEHGTDPRGQSASADQGRDRDRGDREGSNGRDGVGAANAAGGRAAKGPVSSRDDRNREAPEREGRDDRDAPGRDQQARDEKGRDEKGSGEQERDEPNRDEAARRDRRTGRGEADGPGRDRTPPADSHGHPRRSSEDDTNPDPSQSTAHDEVDEVNDTSAAAPVPSTTPNRDRGTPAGSDPTPALDPGSLRTMGLGGYVTGDFGWFDGRSGRGPIFGVPDVPAAMGGLPVLLALLGAFLALQRGIGRGLGHVPMDATSTEPGLHGQH